MEFVFINEGSLSLIDMVTMGDSDKRLNPNKIGKFDSGLKYALAILHRNNVDITIRTFSAFYKVSSTIKRDTESNKTKSVLTLEKYVNDELAEIIETAFAVNLGYDWDFWMAIRELYSNCIDEKGKTLLIDPNIDNVILVHDNGHTDLIEQDKCYELINSSYKSPHTVITISGDALFDIYDNWNNYFIDTTKTQLYDSSAVQIYNNKREFLRIYKRGILIYEDLHETSMYIYNINNAGIDERRVLSDFDGIKNQITSTIQYCSDKDFINIFIADLLKVEISNKNKFEVFLNYFWGWSATWIEVVNTRINKLNKSIPACLKKSLSEDKRSDIGIKTLYASSPEYNYRKVSVTPVSKNILSSDAKEEVPLTSVDYVLKVCADNNIDLEDIKIVLSKISDSQLHCVANIYDKIIYVNSDLKGEHFWEVIKAIYRIKGDDNYDYIYKELTKLLIKII